MAAIAQHSVMSVAAAPVARVQSVQREVQGLRLAAPRMVRKQAVAARTGAMGATADYLGSPTNLVFVASTTAFLVAGRFGLAPSSNRTATAGSKLVERPSGQQTGDPAGFTAADVLAFGALGHIAAAGIVQYLAYGGSI